jgi:hypothetical protein
MLISLGKISTAFNLTPNEIHELWHSLPTQPVIKLDKLKIDPADREIHKEFPFVESNDIIMNINADRYAERLKWPGLRRRTVDFVLEHLLDMYREREFEEGIQSEWNDLAARWRHEQFYGLIFSRLRGHVAELQKEVSMVLKSSYVFFSCVQLDEVVQLMHESAYPLRQEVKGLTRARYQEIIDKLQAPPPAPAEEQTTTVQPEVALPESISENLPNVPTVVESPPASGQRRLSISTLLNVIKAEADTYGLDKKYYVTTDRTIRNWLKGTSTPPCGFSSEVLSSLEAIAEFAQKYIEAVVAAGSSELAANAKKEVSFNEQLHGIKLETSEDAELMMDALKDASKHLSGGSKPVVKRKRRPF